MTPLLRVHQSDLASIISPALLALLYSTTLAVSAGLLFSIQPMFAKLVLPLAGGSASVWSIAVVFFQTLLLAGYGYAHLLARSLRPGIALWIHLGVMVSAGLMLPISVPHGWGKLPEHGASLWLVGLFGLGVGLPFLAVSANGPLLQSWFSASGHKKATDPYFLYAASNIGSFGALLLYPAVLEPLLTTHEQTHWWSTGFIILGALVATCGLVVAGQRPVKNAAAVSQHSKASVTWRDRLVWLALSFVPSGLLVSVTGHITTDLAQTPLLWVLPLALFLLTFVLTFRYRPLVSIVWLSRFQVWSTALVFISFTVPLWLGVSLTLHLITFFVSALVCHAALYTRRPDVEHLTAFYLYSSLGGALGGIFCSLVAPWLFSTILEYPLLLAAALFCRPGFFTPPSGIWLREAVRVSLFVTLPLVGGGLLAGDYLPTLAIRLVVVIFVAIALVIDHSRPQSLMPTAAALVLSVAVLPIGTGEITTIRSFFGVHKIEKTADGRFLKLSHGTTLHGAVRLLNDDGTSVIGRPEPATYYTFDGPLGRAIVSVRGANGRALESVALIGLGAGSLSCHKGDGESWTFFEIDPEVIRIAKHNLFRFLPDCAPEARIVLGDARITLPDHRGDNHLIIVDAFSSDAIPSHLVTSEAFALYLSKLAPSGSIAIHISNWHLELRNIIARTAADHGLTTYVLCDPSPEPLERRFRTSSCVALIARESAHLGPIVLADDVQRVDPDLTRRPWTDDFSNILEAVRDRHGW